MVAQSRPLIEVLAEIRDFRHPRGKRHPFVAVLALAWSAMLCGYRSDTAIAEWGRHYGHQWVRAFGFPGARPVLRHCIRLYAESTGSAWKPSWALGRGSPGENTRSWRPRDAVALDGKTLRGSQKRGAPGAPLPSAFAPRHGLTLVQQAVADQTNDMPVILALLRHLVLVGQVVTRDALLTQRQMAQRMMAVGRLCEAGQRPPQLLEDMQTVCALAPFAGEQQLVAATLDLGHGRIEPWRLQTRTVLVGYRDGLSRVSPTCRKESARACRCGAAVGSGPWALAD